MTTLYITEYIATGTASGSVNPIAMEPPIHEQTIALTGSSAQSTTLLPQTNFVRLHSDSICSIEFGTNPTATLTTRRMAANQTEYFAIPSFGGPYKYAAIVNT